MSSVSAFSLISSPSASISSLLSLNTFLNSGTLGTLSPAFAVILSPISICSSSTSTVSTDIVNESLEYSSPPFTSSSVSSYSALSVYFLSFLSYLKAALISSFMSSYFVFSVSSRLNVSLSSVRVSSASKLTVSRSDLISASAVHALLFAGSFPRSI